MKRFNQKRPSPAFPCDGTLENNFLSPLNSKLAQMMVQMLVHQDGPFLRR
jgi:hypothetical protein